MANRRMFAKSIIGSARFLRMPVSARLLYYDLGMMADDEGIVEAFPVMRMTGASEDDLKVLNAKQFVHVVNDDLVTVIMDWKTNNSIRADRFVPSLYHDIVTGFQDGNQLTTTWQPNGNQTETQYRLGKDSTGKDSTGQGKEDDDASTGENVDVHNVFGYVSSYINLSPTAFEELKSFSDDGITDDVIKWSVDTAIDNNKRSWSYVRAILNRCMDQGYKTLADVKNAEAERQAAKAKQKTESPALHGYQEHQYTENDFNEQFYYDPTRDLLPEDKNGKQ